MKRRLKSLHTFRCHWHLDYLRITFRTSTVDSKKKTSETQKKKQKPNPFLNLKNPSKSKRLDCKTIWQYQKVSESILPRNTFQTTFTESQNTIVSNFFFFYIYTTISFSILNFCFSILSIKRFLSFRLPVSFH